MMKILLTAFTVIALTEARKFVIQSKPSDTEKLFDKNSFTFSQDKQDNKDPTVFTGDVQKSKVVVAENFISKNKDFKYAVGTNNGIEVEQQGKLKNTGNSSVLVVQGSYSYTGADGRRYRVRYTADEFGFHPITELEIELPDSVSGEKVYKPLEPFKFPKFGEFKLSTTKRTDYNSLIKLKTTTKKSDKYQYGVKGGPGSNGINPNANGNGNGLGNRNGNGVNNGNGINAGNPFSQSNFPSKRYLPANTYLPPTEYLPPQPNTDYLPPRLLNQI